MERFTEAGFFKASLFRFAFFVRTIFKSPTRSEVDPYYPTPEATCSFNLRTHRNIYLENHPDYCDYRLFITIQYSLVSPVFKDTSLYMVNNTLCHPE